MGLGYIGLPTASLLATRGSDVVGVDVRPEIVETINRGNIHIHEPDLDVLVKSAVISGKLKAALKPEAADVFIIAVPTPFKENHLPDLSFVEQATQSIAPYLKPGNLVILESTSPVGTTEKIADWLRPLRKDLEFPRRSEAGIETPSSSAARIYLAHCPERVLPGRILKELIDNDRIVGGVDHESSEVAGNFYRKFVSGHVYQTNARTAELAKLSENSFRDVNIAFANELSMICEELKIDVWELIDLANCHPRVSILDPGPGVGGHCIAVDPWFIVSSAPKLARLIAGARHVNEEKPEHVISRVKDLAKRFRTPNICCLGLSFKADVDDFRESPALRIVERLAAEKVGRLTVVEPHLKELPPSLAKFSDVSLKPLAQGISESDILLVLVNHREFLHVERAALTDKIIIDTRGMWRERRRNR